MQHNTPSQTQEITLDHFYFDLYQKSKADLNSVRDYYYHEIQQSPNKIDTYYQAIVLYPNDIQLYIGLAQAQAWHHQLDKAILSYQKALQNCPDNLAAFLGLKLILERKRYLKKVIQQVTVISNDYAAWLKKNLPRIDDIPNIAEQAVNLVYKPVISILMSLGQSDQAFLKESIHSVLAQIYPNWELYIVEDPSQPAWIHSILSDYREGEKRIKVISVTEKDTSFAANLALTLAKGEFITCLKAGDLLSPDALYEISLRLNQHSDTDIIYSDEDTIDEKDQRYAPYFKPDWCPDSILSRNYVGHLAVYRRSLVNHSGGFKADYKDYQEYDLLLRLSEQTDQILHIPKVLYHRRYYKTSELKDNCQQQDQVTLTQKIIAETLRRRGEEGRAIRNQNFKNVYTIRYNIQKHELVSIIIPTRNLARILDQCLDSIFCQTTYPNYEVILIDNGSNEPETIETINTYKQKQPERFQCYAFNIPFNYSRLNNYGVQKARGKYLLFLNNDTEVITPDWLEAMVEQAQRPSIGAVGAFLLYPDHTLQHAGIIMGVNGIAGHSHKYFSAHHPGYFYQLMTSNNYSAVTAACLMCRREVFQQVKGFNEELAVAYNDVDLCLKLRRSGYNNICLSHVQLYHYESKSRGLDNTPEKKKRIQKEVEYMQDIWNNSINYDPYYSPNLTREKENYSMR